MWIYCILYMNMYIYVYYLIYILMSARQSNLFILYFHTYVYMCKYCMLYMNMYIYIYYLIYITWVCRQWSALPECVGNGLGNAVHCRHTHILPCIYYCRQDSPICSSTRLAHTPLSRRAHNVYMRIYDWWIYIHIIHICIHTTWVWQQGGPTCSSAL